MCPVKNRGGSFVKGVDQNFFIIFYFAIYTVDITFSLERGSSQKGGGVGKVEFENGERGKLESRSGRWEVCLISIPDFGA